MDVHTATLMDLHATPTPVTEQIPERLALQLVVSFMMYFLLSDQLVI